MEQALFERHLAEIDEQGYTIVSALEPDETALYRDTIRRVADDLDVTPRGNRIEGFSTRRIYNLISRDPVLWQMPIHPEVVPFAERLLDEECLLSGTTAIDLGPGEVAQQFHSDEGFVRIPRPRIAMMCVTLWALTDFTADNGATRIVPGSHRAGREPHPDEDCDWIPAEMPAGSVLVMHGGMWHSGGANTTDDDWRLGVNVQYGQGWLRQQQNPYFSYPAEQVRQFPRRLQQLCGFTLYKGATGHVDGVSPGAVIGAEGSTERAYADYRRHPTALY